MRGQATTPPLSCAKTKSALVWRKEEGMTGPHSKSTNLPAGVPTLPPVKPLPSAGEMRSLAYNAQLGLDVRMGRPTSSAP